jgi:hypothetical protein
MLKRIVKKWNEKLGHICMYRLLYICLPLYFCNESPMIAACTHLFSISAGKILLYRVCKKKGNQTSAGYCIWITLRIWTRYFHIRKDQAFSCWMICSSYQMDKKWANTNSIKNVSHNRIFSPLRVGSKTIEN